MNNFCNTFFFCCFSTCIPKRIRVVYEVTVNRQLRCQHVTASMGLYAMPAKRILYIRMNRHNWMGHTSCSGKIDGPGFFQLLALQIYFFGCVTLEICRKEKLNFFFSNFSQNQINVTHLNSKNAIYDTPVPQNKAAKRVCSL